MLFAETYIGVATKAGGMIMAGIDGMAGRVYNLANPGYNVAFTMTNIKVGLGAGGGIGTVLVVAYHIRKLRDLEKTNQGWDWGVGLDVGAFKGKALASAISNHEGLATVVKLAKKISMGQPNPDLVGEDLTKMRLVAHQIYNVGKLGQNGPEMLCFDLPVGGAGLEVSFSFSYPLEGVKIIY
jgi:heme/copper-type cytochrome/quinol oxidase subunit 1